MFEWGKEKMELSNMLSKMFGKKSIDSYARSLVKFIDRGSTMLIPEPEIRDVLIYKSLNLSLEYKPS